MDKWEVTYLVGDERDPDGGPTADALVHVVSVHGDDEQVARHMARIEISRRVGLETIKWERDAVRAVDTAHVDRPAAEGGAE